MQSWDLEDEIHTLFRAKTGSRGFSTPFKYYTHFPLKSGWDTHSMVSKLLDSVLATPQNTRII